MRDRRTFGCRPPGPTRPRPPSAGARARPAPGAPIAPAGSRTSSPGSPARRSASSTMTTARWRTLSSNVGIPIGRVSRPSPLRDVHPPHRRRLVRAGLGAVQQRPEVALQVRRVVRRGLSVHARGPVLARAPVRLVQPVDVDVVGQRRERHLRRLAAPAPLSAVVALRRYQARCPRMFPSSGLMTRRPLPSTGSLGSVPLLHRYYEALRLPAAHPAALRCLRLAVPRFAPVVSLPRPPECAAAGLELVTR